MERQSEQEVSEMNERIKELIEQCRWQEVVIEDGEEWIHAHFDEYKFAELIVKECIEKIETHRIPVGNSPAGELACEWTYDALKCVRDEIKEHFGVKE